MGDKMNIGDYGEISFILRKKRKVPLDGEAYIETGVILHGTVADIDKNNVLIVDNDELIYIVRKKDIRGFESKDKHKELKITK